MYLWLKHKFMTVYNISVDAILFHNKMARLLLEVLEFKIKGRLANKV